MPGRFRRHPVGTVLAIAALGVFSANRLGWLARPGGGDYERYDGVLARVVRVIDGDTLEIGIGDGERATTRVRLWGIDTPEMKGAKGPMYYGAEAAAFVREWARNREVRVELSAVGTRGKYGRLLAYLYGTDTNEMLNEALLVGGYAQADRRFEHEQKARFGRLEREARRAGVGMWAEVREGEAR